MNHRLHLLFPIPFPVFSPSPNSTHPIPARSLYISKPKTLLMMTHLPAPEHQHLPIKVRAGAREQNQNDFRKLSYHHLSLSSYPFFEGFYGSVRGYRPYAPHATTAFSAAKARAESGAVGRVNQGSTFGSPRF